MQRSSPCAIVRAARPRDADERHPRRPVGPPTVRDRREVRAVGLDQHAFERAAAARGLATSAALLNVTIPEKLTKAPVVEARAGLVGSTGEAVEDRPLGHALGVEHVERVVPRVAGVDHERQPALVGEADLGGERRRAARRGASGRSSSRARTPPIGAGRRRRRRASKRSTIVSTPWRASCGCRPTVACTAGWRRAHVERGERRGPVAADGDHRAHAGVEGRLRRRRRRRPACARRRRRGSGVVRSSGGLGAPLRSRDAREQRARPW